MSGKNILKESFVKVRGFVFGFVLSVVLVAGAVFAAGGAQNMQNKWDAFWHGTSWIQAGKVVESERIAENFEWLKNRTDNLQSQIDNLQNQIDNIINNGGGGGSNCPAQTVTSIYKIITCVESDCLNVQSRCDTTTYTGNYNCPDSLNGELVECQLQERPWLSLTGTFQCLDGNFVLKDAAQYTSYQVRSCSCFTKQTLITMADGSKKKITDIKAGDKVLGKGGAVNRVKGMERVPLAGRKLYSINDSSYFVTAEHPFLTKDGWKSIDPRATLKEKPSLAQKLNPKTLKVGDVLITEKGEVLIKSIKSKEAPEQTVYNLILDGNNTYYADGFLVHNKD